MKDATAAPRPTASLPRLATWLLEKWGSPRYRDSLLGDLIELRREGASSLWCWKQVICALWLARLGASSPRWIAAAKAVIVAFGIILLGAGTFAWAESVHGDGGQAHLEVLHAAPIR